MSSSRTIQDLSINELVNMSQLFEKHYWQAIGQQNTETDVTLLQQLEDRIKWYAQAAYEINGELKIRGHTT